MRPSSRFESWLALHGDCRLELNANDGETKQNECMSIIRCRSCETNDALRKERGQHDEKRGGEKYRCEPTQLLPFCRLPRNIP
jgi:hypothetical protein